MYVRLVYLIHSKCLHLSVFFLDFMHPSTDFKFVLDYPYFFFFWLFLTTQSSLFSIFFISLSSLLFLFAPPVLVD